MKEGEKRSEKKNDGGAERFREVGRKRERSEMKILERDGGMRKREVEMGRGWGGKDVGQKRDNVSRRV